MSDRQTVFRFVLSDAKLDKSTYIMTIAINMVKIDVWVNFGSKNRILVMMRHVCNEIYENILIRYR